MMFRFSKGRNLICPIFVCVTHSQTRCLIQKSSRINFFSNGRNNFTVKEDRFLFFAENKHETFSLLLLNSATNFRIRSDDNSHESHSHNQNCVEKEQFLSGAVCNVFFHIGYNCIVLLILDSIVLDLRYYWKIFSCLVYFSLDREFQGNPTVV